MKIYLGDITTIKNIDVLVNASDTDFTPGGGLARWIAQEGGEKIFADVRETVGNTSVTIGEVYASIPGDLAFKQIFHIPTVNWETSEKLTLPEVHSVTINACEKAIDGGYKSIVFPLLGAGTVGLSGGELAKEITDALAHIEEDHADFQAELCVLKKSVFDNLKSSITAKYSLINLEDENA
jgi:O-acetyl-ADP-ribose deacetylase (regulator of RNase III)